MNLLITGGTGFIGTRLLSITKERLASEEGSRVIALSSRLIDGYSCVLHRNYTFKKEDFYQAGVEHIDAVIHLGGYSPKDRSEMGARDQYLASIQNTQYLLDHLPNVPSQFIFGSTISVYDETTDGVITEKTVPHPSTLYGMYKLYCEKLVSTWGTEKDVLVHNLRLGNVYGPGEEKYRYMIPMMIRKALEGKDLSLYVDPSIKRNYIYVDDVCSMILNALEISTDVGIINLVSSRNVTMGDIVRTIAKSVKSSVGYSVAENKIEAKNILFSGEKARKFLGAESYDFETGIMKECRYFEKLLPWNK